MELRIQNLLAFERIEAQELIGHFDIFERFSSDSSFTATLEVFQIKCPMALEAMKRDKLYRYAELNNRKGFITEKNRSLYHQITKRVLCDQTINIKGNIPLNDAVNYKLHYPCIRVEEEGPYGANFPNDSTLYIFNTRNVLFELVLDGYILPSILQKSLGISQNANPEKKKHSTRDIIAQTLAHILFSSENNSLKWDQTKILEHRLIKVFKLDAYFCNSGGRPLKEAMKQVIPSSVRRKGSSQLKKYTQEELNLTPLMIPEIYFGNGTIDFTALRIILRTVLLVIKAQTPIGHNISKKDLYELPVLKQFREVLTNESWSICEYDLLKFSKKFGRGEYIPSIL